MQQGNQSTSAFLLLHGGSAHVASIERLDSTTITVECGGTGQIITEFDYRDQRTLLIFDGAIPPQGLPRATRVQKLSSYYFCKKSENTRASSREEEWPMPIANVWFDVEMFGFYKLRVDRYAILAPACELLLCRFRPENFGLQYVFTEVRRLSEHSQVTWRFHSP